MTTAPRASILLVDDTPANLVALRAILEPLGQELVSVGSGREALRALLRQEFALILMDVRMADMGGVETARLIRARPRTERVPIIFITAFDRAEIDMLAGYRVGAADFIFKPFQPDALRAKVSVFVDLFQKTEEVRRQAEQLRRMEEREHRRRLALAERGREAAEARFQNILEVAPDGILALDESGRVMLFNQGAERLFGYVAGDVLGADVAMLLPGGVPAAGSDGVPALVEVVGRRRGGDEFPVEVAVSRMAAGDEAIVTVVCRDITERKRAEDQVRALNHELGERLRMGVDMVADLAGSLRPAEVMDRVLLRLLDAAGAQVGMLLRADGSNPRRYVVQTAHDLGRRESLAPGTQFPHLPLIGSALSGGRPVLNGHFSAAGASGQVRRWLEGVRYTAALPLRVGNETPAVILLGRREGGPFGQRELETLEMIGNVAAVALRNAQLFVAAEAASVSKSEFLNMAAHELRTPLSVINGYLSMLTDGTLGPPGEHWKQPIEILGLKAAELNKLVDGLLLAARMEAGTIQGQPAVVDLGRMARDALMRAQPRAELLGGQLLLEVPPAPVLVEADPSHLERILDNLVNNALTYSMERPWVKVSVGEDPSVTVEDHGMGVPDDRRDAIFERFYRVNDPALPPQPGTGLGLYLSRELARRNGGDVELDWSSPGEGSRFVLRLAAVAEAEAAAAPAAPA